MNRGRALDIDWMLVTPVLVLVFLSLATLFSINFSLFKTQLFFLIVSIFAFVFVSQADHKVIRYYSLPIYIVSLLILVLILILGIQSRGAVRWFDIFGWRIQFSEIFKPFLAISLSAFLIKRQPNFKTLALVLIYLMPVVFLIYRQPDLGNATIYFLVAMLSLVVYGFPIIWFVAGTFAFLGVLPFFWNFLHEYQRQRVLTLFNPASDPLGTSYNAIQSIIAVGSGMFFGKGFGQGSQSFLRFLPEQHTDFIFATLSEEFGFLIALIVVLSFVFLLYRIFLIFTNSPDKFCRILSCVLFFFILVQAFVNMGMNIGIVPVVGVTLPFVSYGGSSLLSSFIILGILSSISRTSKREEVLEIR